MGTLEKLYPKLGLFLRLGSLGVGFDGSQVQRPLAISSQPTLQYYGVDAVTQEIINHNLTWARTEEGSPRFQFIYLMLPTPCNQRCVGCFMGQDKGRLPAGLSGPYFTPAELEGLVGFAIEHGARALVYGGCGELFAWPGAMDLVERVSRLGLPMVIFTNGTLLTLPQIVHLNELGAVLIVSLRDTVEAFHDAAVGIEGFQATLRTIDTCLAVGMQKDQRLAVEIPVIRANEQRVLDDLLPVLRALGIVPWIEEFILTSTSQQDRELCHDFAAARRFFERAAARDAELGILWIPENGQRMIGQPQCRRPLYSFAVFPSGEVMDCPSHFASHGNLHQKSLHDIIYSRRFRDALLGYKLCPCSVFYTKDDDKIPPGLPGYLEAMKR